MTRVTVTDMSQSEPTLTEIMRRLDELSADVKNIPVMVNDQFVRHEVYKTQYDYIEKRLAHLEGRHEWVIRTIGAIIISAVLGLVITYR